MNHNEEHGKSRRRSIEHLVCAVVFTAVQLWAVVFVLVGLDVGGAQALAVAVLAAGGLLAVHDAWREVHPVKRAEKASVEPGELVRQ
ncbi:hypothetical protein [Saccharothrix coeruleofusca]|uniref:Uncharacterized protein n=1 Tax=Saccharothrix coeruleofusca TaxID=33919 RepID=A0A918EE10_9PSEU|nr:hypothetical protein [Saccharothrix coeruleofusca]MBP2338376.1 hypothetical protein [Saccharothrix coeruleofusca]GGP48755.1 hypothetical protein GCM10010185_21080 [Saccharothrix coeruleofusca]